jgi:hypothetical protein
MPRIVVTFNAENLQHWEKAFRTHGALFKEQTIVSPWLFSVDESDNSVTLSADVDDLDTLTKVLESSETADALSGDGVERGSYKLVVLDKQFDF